MASARAVLGLITALCGPCATLAAPPDLDAMRYRLHCSGCHQPDGSGIALGGVPPVKDMLGYFLNSDRGRAFLVQVPGTSQSPLTDPQVASLLNWMIATFSAAQAPPGYAPFTAQEVTRLRAQRLDDVMGARASIVADLRAKGFALR